MYLFPPHPKKPFKLRVQKLLMFLWHSSSGVPQALGNKPPKRFKQMTVTYFHLDSQCKLFHFYILFLYITAEITKISFVQFCRNIEKIFNNMWTVLKIFDQKKKRWFM